MKEHLEPTAEPKVIDRLTSLVHGQMENLYHETRAPGFGGVYCEGSFKVIWLNAYLRVGKFLRANELILIGGTLGTCIGATALAAFVLFRR